VWFRDFVRDAIAAESRHLLFEKFSQVDQTDARKIGESFLGLAISHRLGGGDVWAIGVTSIVGELQRLLIKCPATN
jgi:signal transduction histidine kinase